MHEAECKLIEDQLADLRSLFEELIEKGEDEMATDIREIIILTEEHSAPWRLES